MADSPPAPQTLRLVPRLVPRAPFCVCGSSNPMPARHGPALTQAASVGSGAAAGAAQALLPARPRCPLRPTLGTALLPVRAGAGSAPPPRASAKGFLLGRPQCPRGTAALAGGGQGPQRAPRPGQGNTSCRPPSWEARGSPWSRGAVGAALSALNGVSHAVAASRATGLTGRLRWAGRGGRVRGQCGSGVECPAPLL